MDWSKVKSVLIVVFIIINVFLLYNLIALRLNNSIPKDTILSAQKILKDRGVAIKCKIPEHTTNDCKLDVLYFEYDKEKICNKLLKGESSINIVPNKKITIGSKSIIIKGDYTVIYENPLPDEKINVTDLSSAKEYLIEFIKELGLPEKDYILDSSFKDSDNKYKLNFNCKYYGYLNFDNYIKASISAAGIDYLEFRVLDEKSLKRDTKRIIPAYQVLLKNFTGENKEVITGIDLGFKEISDNNFGKKYYGFVWRVKAENGKAFYYKAYNGEYMK